MPNNYSVTLTATVKTWPGNNGDITDYSIAATLDTTLPAGCLAVDSTGDITVALIRGSDNKISSPVSPGDKITFTFGGSTGYTVTGVTGLHGNLGGLAFGPTSTSNGTTSITATVNSGVVAKGSEKAKYTIVMGMNYSTDTASIDPDFETDVTDAAK